MARVPPLHYSPAYIHTLFTTGCSSFTTGCTHTVHKRMLLDEETHTVHNRMILDLTLHQVLLFRCSPRCTFSLPRSSPFCILLDYKLPTHSPEFVARGMSPQSSLWAQETVNSEGQFIPEVTFVFSGSATTGRIACTRLW